MEATFPLHYAGSVWYWQQLQQHREIIFDRHHFFQKQSYHNRCYIAGPNGKQLLTIPTAGSHFKRPLIEIEISYSEPWQKIHWNAIKTAYGSSPFFEYYDYLLQPFYEKQVRFLADFNLQLTQWLMQQLKLKPAYRLSETPALPPLENDYRTIFTAKKEPEISFKRYPQVFEQKHGFIPNLSVLDTLFNQGPAALDFIK
ncbi:MAG: WbqC family protein [Bacteroidia bacterium]|nr:WbqC family protein [Bacteroidia bacterium]